MNRAKLPHQAKHVRLTIMLDDLPSILELKIYI
jgi:hypothetical protein